MMGLNTAAIILNDCLGGIEEDGSIGKGIAEAVHLAHRGRGDVTARGKGITYINAISVLPPVHADSYQVVLVGGNTIQPLTTVSSYEPEIVLREMARQAGFTLHRKKATK